MARHSALSGSRMVALRKISVRHCRASVKDVQFSGVSVIFFGR
ncbi:hypothetical protein XNA1_2010015 [Xenorhabdus nematophila str. Anatoliense]|nr:hypothetical protein XNA1_2010015 [Xenorhabdus nematophila str. Anatoliense]